MRATARHGRWLFRVGSFALALALIAAVAPLPGDVRAAVGPAVGPQSIWILGLATVGLVVARAVTGRPNGGRTRATADDGGTSTAVSSPPDWDVELADGVTGNERLERLFSREFRDDLRTATDGESSDARASARTTVRRRLASVAVDVVAESEGVSREVAAGRVADGSWTDRRRAAVLLADPGNVPPLPLATRIRDWLSGEPFARQIDAAIVDIAAAAGVETEVTPP